MKEFFHDKKVLITGHTGFKGSWLTEVLLGWGAEVVGVSLRPATTPNLYDVLLLESRVHNYYADIRDEESMKAIFTKEAPDIVFHLAAQPIVRRSYDDPLETFSTNCMGTANILEAIRCTPSIRAAVIITTDKVYENKETDHAYREDDPLGGYDPYSASKAAADIISTSYLRSFFNPDEYGAKHTTLIAIARAGNVIGGGDWSEHRLIPDIVRSVYEKKTTLTIRNPLAVRPWQHVLEPLSGYLMLAKRLYEGNMDAACPWNFGPYPDAIVPVQDVLAGAKRACPEISYDVVSDDTKHEAGLLSLDIHKAINMLGWKPRLSLDDSLALTFDWYTCFYQSPEKVRDYTKEQITAYFTQS